MPATCFTCGEVGHVATECGNASYVTGTRSYDVRVPLKRDPTPPTAEYLAAREEIGMPTSGPDVLPVGCPWCKSPAWRRCLNVGTGRETDPHYQRQAAAGVERPSIRLQELALRQVAESRAARLVV